MLQKYPPVSFYAYIDQISIEQVNLQTVILYNEHEVSTIFVYVHEKDEKLIGKAKLGLR